MDVEPEKQIYRNKNLKCNWDKLHIELMTEILFDYIYSITNKIIFIPLNAFQDGAQCEIRDHHQTIFIKRNWAWVQPAQIH